MCVSAKKVMRMHSIAVSVAEFDNGVIEFFFLVNMKSLLDEILSGRTAIALIIIVR